MTCEVCEHTAPIKSHRCRFEQACACWWGIPCDGMGQERVYPGRRKVRNS